MVLAVLAWSMFRQSQAWRLLLVLLALVIGWTGGNHLAKAAKPALSSEILKALQSPASGQLNLQIVPLSMGTVYYAVIPSQLEIVPGVTDKLQPITAFQSGTPATAARLIVNAGYFDPNNQKTTAYITINGAMVGDPTTNEHLTGNKNLKPYLNQIFNRSELRVYDCKGRTRYDITRHQDALPSSCTLRHAMGAGPQLLPEDLTVQEAAAAYDQKGRLIRDPLGINTHNARTALGITSSGNIILLMAAQNPSQPGSGFTVGQVTSLLKSLGAVKAMALDGGSSSALLVRSDNPSPNKQSANENESNKTPNPEQTINSQIYNNQVYYGKFTKEGQPVRRPIKSVLKVVPRS